MKKRTYKCGGCGDYGHNKRTCPSGADVTKDVVALPVDEFVRVDVLDGIAASPFDYELFRRTFELQLKTYSPDEVQGEVVVESMEEGVAKGGGFFINTTSFLVGIDGTVSES